MFSVYAYFAARVGLKLVGKAFLLVFSILITTSVLAYGLSELSPPGSFERIIIFSTVVVFIEDACRTWFVTRPTYNFIHVRASAVAFSISASSIETLVQSTYLIECNIYNSAYLSANIHIESYVIVFLLHRLELATIAFEAVRPFIHYLLCIAMYYSWKMDTRRLWSFLLLSHISVDVILYLISDNGAFSDIKALGVALTFAAFLYMITYRIRKVNRSP